ncbi:Site-specific recombinase XerD [Lentibacter algarum]|uniref:Site-specific recombinase XerD n=2 Tax=Lentibacter algarum TaxID=576131 RepID=A0A1H3NQT7_9RHOB|nr:Site-specific recombinase XerD [Lentibacter algarum]
MSPQIKYAYKRHNTWIYRRTYPKALQPLLGSALKQSLKTGDATQAKARVAELNQTFAKVVAEAQDSMPRQGDALGSSPTETSSVLPTAAQAPRLGVTRPRYQRVRLVGDGLVAELAQAYLAEVSQRLRPGSYKSVRFALELLTSHLGNQQVGALTQAQGREVLGYITQLSPNVRKYREGKGATLPELATLSREQESTTLAPQTQARVLKQMSQFLDWCVGEGELGANPWEALKVKDRPEVHPHGMLSDAQVRILLSAKDRVLHSALLFGLLTGMRSGEICGLMAEDITGKGNLGRFISIRPNRVRLLKSKAAEREVPLHGILEQLLDTALPKSGRLFPHLSVDRVVKRYALLRRRHPELSGTVFHSTRKWFITQCERTGVPEHFTASLVGHHSARSANKLTYGLYSAGISDDQKREIVDGVRLPDWEGTS